MDIVVTIPKDKLAQVETEEAMAETLNRQGGERVYYFWNVHHVPKNLKKNDRCFFVWEGAVRAFHRVIGFGEDMTCSYTGQFYKGACLLLDPEVCRIDPIAMRSFRGFRYFDLKEHLHAIGR